MDACRSLRLRAGFSFCLAWALLLAATGCGLGGVLGTLNSQVDDGQGDGPVDLTNGDGACATNYVNADFGLGLDLTPDASEAPGFVGDEEAEFTMAWVFSSGGVTITLDVAVRTEPFPAQLAQITEAANEAVSLAGGTVNTPVDVVLADGDAAMLTGYTLDHRFGYRVDLLAGESSYAATATVNAEDLTQDVDNAMVSAVTSLCVE